MPSIFEYYDMLYDSGTAKQILNLVDAKLDRKPIRIIDTMFIQSLKNAL